MKIRDRMRLAADALFGRVAPSNYDAGRYSRVDPDFAPRVIGPNGLSDETLDLARRRTRHLCDNHPLLKAAKNVYRDNTLGENGIMIRPATRWPELNNVLRDLWYLFEDAVNVARNRTFGMEQRRVLDECFDGGDVLVHTPIVPAFNEEPAGPAFDLIQAEQIDLSLNEEVAGGGQIRQGVEFDALQRPVAYWCFPEHPSDGGMMALRSGRKGLVRVPAESAELAMLTGRPGQVRGVPVPIAAVRTTRIQDGYEEANLQLALAIACQGLLFEGLNLSQLKAGRIDPNMPSNLATGMPIIRTSPAMVGTLPQGAKVHQLAPTHPGPNFLGVEKLLAQHMASATGTSYAEISDDYGDATFSSERARQLAKRKGYRPAQVVMHRVSGRPLYRAFIRFSVAFDVVKLTPEQKAAWRLDPRALYKHEPMWPGWDWVNPQQEAQAAEIALRTGTKSPIAICAESGKHFEDVIDETIAFRKYEKEQYEKAGLPVPTHEAPTAGGDGDGTDRTDGTDKKDKSPNQLRAMREERVAALNGTLNGAH